MLLFYNAINKKKHGSNTVVAITFVNTMTVHVLPMIVIAHLVKTMKNLKININRHHRLELPKSLGTFTFITYFTLAQ